MKDALLVTGGCGYIGSHTANRLLERGGRVVVVDDLSTGHHEVARFFERVYGPNQFAFEHVSLLDGDALKASLERHEIRGVVDFAAKCLVEESQREPEAYFETNIVGFQNLLACTPGIPVVKSSTCAVYGELNSDQVPVSETYLDSRLSDDPPRAPGLLPGNVDLETLVGWFEEKVGRGSNYALTERDRARLLLPTSVYGVTKAMDELILEKVRERRSSSVLRYFNVIGAEPLGLLGEDHRPETHLLPLVIEVALGRRDKIVVFGDDYETPDGTAVRDYLYVEDLAEAHIRCIDRLTDEGTGCTLNLGTGVGHSVREIVDAVRKATGHEIPEHLAGRRSGDPSALYAEANAAKKEIGWEASASLEQSVETAWNWHRTNPAGYRAVHERRFNPFWGRWMNIATGRGDRPWHGERESLESEDAPSYDPDCYLCPGNQRASGERNPDYRGVWSFVNDFPALEPNIYEPEESTRPYVTSASRGVCEVINYHHDHSIRMSTMDPSEVEAVIEAWAASYERIGGMPDVRYVLISENRGTVMGNSMPHSHGQIFGYTQIPDLMVVPQVTAFREQGCFVCHANEMEVGDGRRVLTSNDSWIAYVPFAAQLPYDVILAPRDHIPQLLALSKDGRRCLAEILQSTLQGLDKLFDRPYHYSLALTQQPTDDSDVDFHMQVHIASLLRGPGVRKHVVGSDVFGEVINPMDPNHAAAAIRYGMKRAATAADPRAW